MKSKIHEINHSIAFTDGDGEVYINKDLKTYNPALYDLVLAHELGHHEGAYDDDDFLHDLEFKLPFWTKIDFCMKYPRGLYAFSPVAWTKDKIMISWLQILYTLIWIAVIVAGVMWLL